MPQQHTTWAEVDLAALAHNLSEVRRRLAGRAELAAVVKSNAYGHGARECAQALVAAGASWLAVSSPAEIAEQGLREVAPGMPILAMISLMPGELGWVDDETRVTLSSLEQARALEEALSGTGRRLTVHLKADTGMGRLGQWGDKFLELARYAQKSASFEVEGLFTHLAQASPGAPSLAPQVGEFDRLRAELGREGLLPPVVHLAASGGMFVAPFEGCNLVRCGLLLYGGYPDGSESVPLELRPVMKLASRLVQVKWMPKGAGVSYNHLYHLERDSLVAVAPIGYAEGLSIQLTNRGFALVRGQRCRILGRVCMGMTLLDVTEVEGAAFGDEAVFLGAQGNDRITMEEIAKWAGTARHAVTTTISPLIPRVFTNL